MEERKADLIKRVKTQKNELVYSMISQLKENLTEIIDDDTLQNQDDPPSSSTRFKSRLRRYAATELAQLQRKEALQRAMDAYSDAEESDDSITEDERQSPRALFEIKRLTELTEATAPAKTMSTDPVPKNYQRLKEQRLKAQQDSSPSKHIKERRNSTYAKKR